MYGGRSTWVRFSRHFRNRNSQHRRFCNNPTFVNKHQLQPHSGNGNGKDGGSRNSSIRDLEAYRDLDKLDFMKAAKILFSDPPKRKKFGLDFHLVQLFFALMPSLAVYLVAQYARHEMRKMEAELEERKKAEEEEKAKEMEKLAEEEKEQGSDLELLKVKERLEALEETVKEIVVETKKPAGEKINIRDQNQEREDSNRKPEHAAVEKQQTPQPGLGQQQKQQDSEKRESHQEGKN